MLRVHNRKVLGFRSPRQQTFWPSYVLIGLLAGILLFSLLVIF